MKSVTNISSNLSSQLSTLFSKNKHYLEIFLVTLLLLQYMPQELIFNKEQDYTFKKYLNPLFDPIRLFMKNPIVIVLLFFIATYSYYIKRDMNIFFLLLISMVSKKQ